MTDDLEVSIGGLRQILRRVYLKPEQQFEQRGHRCRPHRQM